MGRITFQVLSEPLTLGFRFLITIRTEFFHIVLPSHILSHVLSDFKSDDGVLELALHQM